MHIRIDTAFVLTPDDQPLVTMHEGCVSLHLSSCLTGDHGWSITFTLAHRPIIADLLAAIESLPLDGAGETPVPPSEALKAGMLTFDEERSVYLCPDCDVTAKTAQGIAHHREWYCAR